MSIAFDDLPVETLTRAQEATATPERLALHNMREAVIYTRRVSRGQIEDGALVSLCYAALLRNAKRFDPNRGLRFFAFAKAGLRGELSRFWGSQDTVRNSSKHETGDPPAFAMSFELDHAGNEYGFVPPVEESVEPEFAAIFTKEQFAEVKQVIDRKCTEQERMIITLAYQSGLNFQEIARLLGVTRSAIQAAHARSIRKIRNDFARRKRLFPDEDSGA